MISAARASSSRRTSGRRALTSSVSMAGFKMSPASPPVAHTRTVRTPSAWYLATVDAPLLASSSGWAWTVNRQRSAMTGKTTDSSSPNPRQTVERLHYGRTRRPPGGRVEDPSFWQWVWLGTAVVFAVGEMMNPGSFFLLPFAIGAAVAAILAVLDVNTSIEWVAFIAVSIVFLFGLRP